MLVCPYCTKPLPDLQTMCCGELGHGVEAEASIEQAAQVERDAERYPIYKEDTKRLDWIIANWSAQRLRRFAYRGNTVWMMDDKKFSSIREAIDAAIRGGEK